MFENDEILKNVSTVIMGLVIYGDRERSISSVERNGKWENPRKSHKTCKTKVQKRQKSHHIYICWVYFKIRVLRNEKYRNIRMFNRETITVCEI